MVGMQSWRTRMGQRMRARFQRWTFCRGAQAMPVHRQQQLMGLQQLRPKRHKPSVHCQVRSQAM